MNRPLPEVRELARMLLENASRGSRVDDRIDATHRVLAGLADRLSPLVGVGGFHLLFQRALKRAQGGHAWLSTIQPEATDPRMLSGLGEAVRGVQPEEVAAGMEDAIAELIGLIARFLGADMAIRLVRQSFPELLGGGDRGSGSQETN
jgi:hypothetical protein